jgi:hypothetical protein
MTLQCDCELAIGCAEFEDPREESSSSQVIDLRHARLQALCPVEQFSPFSGVCQHGGEGRYEFAVQGQVDLALLAGGQPSVRTVGRLE